MLVFQYVPGVDLPNHILAAALHAGASEPSQDNFLSAHWLPSPYTLFHLLMFPLIKLFGSTVATKVVLSLYVILLPYSVLCFAREFNPEQRFLAFFSFPFIYTYHFDCGFIPYCMGIPFVFIGLCLVNKGLKRGFPPLILISASLITLTVYFSHFINFAVYVIGVLFVVWSKRAFIPIRFGSKPSSYFSLVGKGILVFAPAILCLCAYSVYLLRSGEGVPSSLKLAAYEPIFHQLAGGARVFFSSDGWVDWLEFAVIAGLILWLLISRVARLNKDVLLYFGILMLLLAVLVPRKSLFGSWDHSSRFAIFGILPLLTSFRINRIVAERLVVLVISLLMAVTIGVRTHRGNQVNNLTHHFVQAVSSAIPPGSKIYTIYNAFPGSRIPLMQHAIAYYHLEHGGYSPFLFADKPYVAGIESSINLPRLGDKWNPEDTLRMSEILHYYDYLVVLTYGSELPPPLLKLSAGIVHRDSICTVIDLGRARVPYGAKPS